MTAFKQNLLATSLLVTALSLSLMIGYWLNQNNVSSDHSSFGENNVQIQKMNKLNHSFVLLLPTIR